MSTLCLYFAAAEPAQDQSTLIANIIDNYVFACLKNQTVQ